MFNVGDYVKIIPTPDKRWPWWQQHHNHYCGRAGELIESQDDPHYAGTLVWKVKIDRTTIWYNENHLMRAKRYDTFLDEEMKKACDKLQEWEKKKKQMRDEMLGHIFSPEETIDTKKEEFDPYDDYECWGDGFQDFDELYEDWEDIPTVETKVPAAGSINSTPVPLPGAGTDTSTPKKSKAPKKTKIIKKRSSIKKKYKQGAFKDLDWSQEDLEGLINSFNPKD